MKTRENDIPTIDDALFAFAVHMKHKLLLTRHRPHWKELDVEVLLDRVAEEVDELCDAIASGDRKAVVRECADVANFVMMIADNAQWDGTRGWNSHEGR